jgi:hypothetical protein
MRFPSNKCSDLWAGDGFADASLSKKLKQALEKYAAA